MLCDRDYQGDFGFDGLLNGSCRLMSCNVDARSVRLENFHCLWTDPGLVLAVCFSLKRMKLGRDAFHHVTPFELWAELVVRGVLPQSLGERRRLC